MEGFMRESGYWYHLVSEGRKWKISCAMSRRRRAEIGRMETRKL